MITSLDQLSPAARAAAARWLDGSLAGVEPELADALRDELELVLCDALGPDATPADVSRVADAVGPLSDLDAATDPRVGTFAGMPYDVRPPTAERLRSRLWNPTDERIFVPRSFGAGWEVNFGALFVRLGVLEPDAEDEPFEHAPERAFHVAAALPVALTGAVILHYAVRGRTLPARLPDHWGVSGRADAWVSRRRAAVTDLAVALAAGSAAVAASGSTGRRPARAAVLAGATGAATGAAAVTIWRSVPDRPRWWAGPALVVALAGSVGGTLLGLALAGRAGEQRRDLGVAT